MKSVYKNLGGVIEMPAFKERKLYMHKTDMNSINLPDEFSDYDTAINTILSKLSDRNNVCYVTIDEKRIRKETHRRSGVHVDFNWYENLESHGSPTLPGHQLTGRHVGDPPSTGWKNSKNDLGGMLLVSNFEGCRVWSGDIIGEIGGGGCCKDIDLSKMETEIMKAGDVFYLNQTGVHESILIDSEINRSLIRINFHPEYIFNPQSV